MAVFHNSFWRHQMETFSASLAICAGNSPVPGEFPAQRPVALSFDVFFDMHPNKWLCKRWWGWWFEAPSCPLWRHRSVKYKTPSKRHTVPAITYMLLHGFQWDLIWKWKLKIQFNLGIQIPSQCITMTIYEPLGASSQRQYNWFSKTLNDTNPMRGESTGYQCITRLTNDQLHRQVNKQIIVSTMLLEWWVFMPCAFWTSVTGSEYWAGVKDCDQWSVCLLCFNLYVRAQFEIGSKSDKTCVNNLHITEVSTIWKVIWLKVYSEFRLYFQ